MRVAALTSSGRGLTSRCLGELVDSSKVDVVLVLLVRGAGFGRRR